MTDKIPGPVYRINTPRLVIRCWNPEDAGLLKTAIDRNLEHLRPWMPWAYNEPQELNKKIELLRGFRGKFDQGQDFVYGILNLDETRVLGGCGLHTRIGPEALEIGYWIDKDFTNQGLATEASAALVKVAFQVESVKRVEIHCDPRNLASATVPRKLGFTHEATLKQRLPFLEGEMTDLMIWTLFAVDYPSSPAASLKIEAIDAIGRRIESEVFAKNDLNT